MTVYKRGTLAFPGSDRKYVDQELSKLEAVTASKPDKGISVVIALSAGTLTFVNGVLTDWTPV